VTSEEKALQEFAQFAAKLKGDEKSEAQTFLFHLLAAFGHDPNTLPEGLTFERPVRLSGERTKCAGFVWPGHCLIEMKSRGTAAASSFEPRGEALPLEMLVAGQGLRAAHLHCAAGNNRQRRKPPHSVEQRQVIGRINGNTATSRVE
jgi:hypothetical protein